MIFRNSSRPYTTGTISLDCMYSYKLKSCWQKNSSQDIQIVSTIAWLHVDSWMASYGWVAYDQNILMKQFICLIVPQIQIPWHAWCMDIGLSYIHISRYHSSSFMISWSLVIFLCWYIYTPDHVVYNKVTTRVIMLWSIM